MLLLLRFIAGLLAGISLLIVGILGFSWVASNPAVLAIIPLVLAAMLVLRLLPTEGTAHDRLLDRIKAQEAARRQTMVIRPNGYHDTTRPQ